MAGLKALDESASWLWCNASRRSHMVVVIDAAKPPAVMRVKFEMPEANALDQAINLGPAVAVHHALGTDEPVVGPDLSLISSWHYPSYAQKPLICPSV